VDELAAAGAAERAKSARELIGNRPSGGPAVCMSLLAEDLATPRVEAYDGYGIGRLLTKALVVRWGGWMAAHAPDQGAGLRFDFVLPQVAPETIPEALNVPEKIC
jgi:hypothetical protein